jgi:hypothetical protein
LPLATRNVAQIAGLSPGVNAGVFNAGELGLGGIALSQIASSNDGIFADGARSYDNNWELDGISVSDVQSSGAGSGGIFPNDPGKGEGADATELLIRQHGLPAKIHPDGSQEDWHEIYRNREADHPGIAKSQAVCGINSALLHVMQCPKHLGRTVAKAKPSR